VFSVKINRILSLVIVISILIPLSVYADATTDASTQPSQAGYRLIVELESPPLAVWYQTAEGAQTASGQLDAQSPAAQSYSAQLEAEQAVFLDSLQKAIPGASPSQYVDEGGGTHDLTYQVAFNGVTVILPDKSPATMKQLAKLPGVKAVYPEREYKPNLDVSHDYMGSADMWAAAGGQANAGEGIKIAVLDTGVDEEHPFFDPTGFSYPPGFPKGDPRYTTEKVIVARGYYRADDPPANPGPTDYHSHGTGTAGIAAGNMDTTAVISNAFSTITKVVSGVAPAAQVMNYQLFYTSVSGSGSAWTPEILMAIDDSVADGADVSNNSWGGADNLNPTVDPIGIAFQNAVDAGVVVAKSAGNAGSAYHSLGDAMPQSLIIAGGNDFGRRVGASASVTGPGTVPSELTNLLAIEAAFTPALTDIFTGTYVYIGRTDVANFEGCDPFDATTAAAVNGNIALISRGACRFDAKVQNADDAGATAAIIFNNQTGSLPIVMGGDPRNIPAVMIGNQAGLDMVDWEAANIGTATVEIDPALAYIPDAALPDTMYQSSSRGPDLAQEIGVDVIAPGESVWTSYSVAGGWNTVSGTSFSSPFVAGAAAALETIYPTWEPWAIKSAMMTTAKNDGIWNDYAHTTHAGVLDMGAGRLQFDKMIDPGLVFDRSSLSFRQMMAGDSESVSIATTDVFSRVAGTDFVYTLTVSETGDIATTANFTLSVDPPTLTFSDDGDTDSFTVTMEIASGATPGDYEGWVWLRHGHHELHIPVWVRVRPEMTEDHVLLLDDDSSAYGFPDYLDVYTNTLETLGYTYDVWPVDLMNYFYGRGFPTVAEMQAYDKIVWFTGDSWYTYLEIGSELQSRNDLFDVMRSGGAKVLATGMDLSGYAYAQNPDDQYPLQVGMATEFLQEDAYAPAATAAPNPAVEGTSNVPAFEDMSFDLGGVAAPTLDTGYGNQFWVDELTPYEDPRMYGGRGFLRSLEPGSAGAGWVGIMRSLGPTFGNEGILPGPDYRTAYLSFGLEGVNNTTGYDTREDLVQEIFNFFQDQLTVTVTVDSTGSVYDLVTLTAHVESSVGAAGAQYRWDFGDGSEIITTDTASVVHPYSSIGLYPVRVEVIDEYGNTAVSEPVLAMAGTILRLPIISRE
jgi:subtilisin family serine protease